MPLLLKKNQHPIVNVNKTWWCASSWKKYLKIVSAHTIYANNELCRNNGNFSILYMYSIMICPCDIINDITYLLIFVYNVHLSPVLFSPLLQVEFICANRIYFRHTLLTIFTSSEKRDVFCCCFILVLRILVVWWRMRSKR